VRCQALRVEFVADYFDFVAPQLQKQVPFFSVVFLVGCNAISSMDRAPHGDNRVPMGRKQKHHLAYSASFV